MFELLNIKWGPSTYGTASGPVSWSEDLDGLPVANGSDVNDIVASLSDAFQSWEDVAALSFNETSGAADISVSYASFSTDSNPLNNGAAGTATWTPTGNGLNEPVDVQIEFNSDFTWSPNGGAGGVDFFAVALHEIGHVIGLNHTWEIGDPESARDDSLIMNALLTTDTLGQGDIAGAQAIYGVDAGDEPVDDDNDDSDDNGSNLGGGDDGGSGGGAAVGLLLGLLALIVGLFSGGLGTAAVVAAGTVATDGDDELAEEDHDHDHDDDHDEDHDDEDDHGHDHPDNFHVLYLPTVPVDETAQPYSEDEDDDDVFLL